MSPQPPRKAGAAAGSRASSAPLRFPYSSSSAPAGRGRCRGGVRGEELVEREAAVIVGLLVMLMTESESPRRLGFDHDAHRARPARFGRLAAAPLSAASRSAPRRRRGVRLRTLRRRGRRPPCLVVPYPSGELQLPGHGSGTVSGPRAVPRGDVAASDGPLCVDTAAFHLASGSPWIGS